ncbi:MAG: hypothetical protein ACI8PZ_005170 [Myxococcota bacterium]|jgi:hypothetical protein
MARLTTLPVAGTWEAFAFTTSVRGAELDLVCVREHEQRMPLALHSVKLVGLKDIIRGAMTAPNHGAPRRPRTLLVSDPTLRRRVTKVLKGSGVSVRPGPPPDDVESLAAAWDDVVNGGEGQVGLDQDLPRWRIALARATKVLGSYPRGHMLEILDGAAAQTLAVFVSGADADGLSLVPADGDLTTRKPMIFLETRSRITWAHERDAERLDLVFGPLVPHAFAADPDNSTRLPLTPGEQTRLLAALEAVVAWDHEVGRGVPEAIAAVQTEDGPVRARMLVVPPRRQAP